MSYVVNLIASLVIMPPQVLF